MSPYQGSSNEKKNKISSGKFSLIEVSLVFDGRLEINSVRTRDFLLLGVVKSRSYC
jgi:hypothetical protein